MILNYLESILQKYCLVKIVRDRSTIHCNRNTQINKTQEEACALLEEEVSNDVSKPLAKKSYKNIGTTTSSLT